METKKDDFGYVRYAGEVLEALIEPMLIVSREDCDTDCKCQDRVLYRIAESRSNTRPQEIS